MITFYTVREESNRIYSCQMDDVNSSEYVYEVNQNNIETRTNGIYEIKMYKNGKEADCIMNGWKFSSNIFGRFKCYDTYTGRKWSFYSLEAYSPKGQKLRIEYNNDRDYLNSEKIVETIYKQMRIVSALCCFKEDYTEIESLFKKKTPAYSLSDVAKEIMDIARLNEWINDKGYEKGERKLAIEMLNKKKEFATFVLEKIKLQ